MLIIIYWKLVIKFVGIKTNAPYKNIYCDGVLPSASPVSENPMYRHSKCIPRMSTLLKKRRPDELLYLILQQRLQKEIFYIA